MKITVIFLMTFWSLLSTAAIDHWETIVYEYDQWKYLTPSSNVSSTWNTLSFNDASWNSGQGGFGFGDGDDNTTFGTTVSCYQRKIFSVVDKAAIDQLVLTIDYDDAFVAYLNGTEIARANISSSGQPSYNQYADGQHEALMYQGQYPSQIVLNAALWQSLLVNGQNVLSIQTHNATQNSSDMTSRVYLHAAINNATTNYGSVPGWFNPPLIFTDSNLPIVVIETENNATIIDAQKINATMGIIYNGEGNRNAISDPFNEYFGKIGIETRGSSSQMFPKKQWGLETRDNFGNPNDITVFNMAWDNDWVLYAPYSDKTLIRNVLAYGMGKDLNTYAPRTKLCEVMLNGEYQGVYVLVEKIKRKDGKVGTNSVLPADVSGNELTGDYIIKVDKLTSGGTVAWTSSIPPYPGSSNSIKFQMHDPELSAMNATQLNYIQSYVTDFENALNGPNFSDPQTGYAAYIDVNSFVDFFLVNEISKNVDGYRISTFLHKIRLSEGGKLFAGPLWDFNLGFGNADYCQGSVTSGWEINFYQYCSGNQEVPFWWGKLLQDPSFRKKVGCRWRELREGPWSDAALAQRIDSLANYLDESQQRNFQRWPIHGTYVWPNSFVGSSYQEDILYMKLWIQQRTSWMDANMFDSCLDLGVQENADLNVNVYPNPGAEKFNFQFKQVIDQGKIEVFNLQGKLVLEEQIENKDNWVVNASQLAPGMYQYKVSYKEKSSTGKLIRN